MLVKERYSIPPSAVHPVLTPDEFPAKQVTPLMPRFVTVFFSLYAQPDPAENDRRGET